MGVALIQLIGHLGRDPELNYTPDGTAVCKFSIAVTFKNKNGEETDWYNIVAWRKLGETMSTYLKKGQKIWIQGTLRPRRYTTNDGRSGMSLDVIAEKFEFFNKKEGGNANPDNIEVFDDTLGSLDDHPF